MIKSCAFSLALVCSQMAFADDYFSLPEDWEQDLPTPLIMASADSNSMGMTGESGIDPDMFKERMITANKVHKYLGIGSLGAAILTGLSPKEEGGPHEAFGQAAAALGVAAMITGLTFHWEDINLNNGFSDPDNLHMMLTTLGTLGFLSAVSEAPDPHGGVGSLGGISMAIGIKMVW